ncbi:MAG: sigma-70 family RNA polymerase sigma factor [Methyloglobulus sp.]|nr:sigma-70 family RNA polymerase sigma factor [Methyloglobulus sp.]
MTNSSSPDIALYWSEALAEELLNFLTKRLKCPDAAADLTQETFLRFYQFVKENPPDNARALAYRIAVNLATDYQRKTKLRNSFTVDVEPAAFAESFKSTAPGPEQTVMAWQHLEQLHVALNELSPDCRTAFLLHGMDGLTYSQIGEHLGISESMVYKHLTKALNHCATLLGVDGTD